MQAASEIAVTNEKKTKRNKFFIFLGIAVLIAVPVIGTTYAASISVGSGETQFGQGQVQTTACDDAITLTPTASFTNAAGAGTFKVGTVVLSGIADACSGKKFKVTAYNNTANSAALTLSSGGAGSPSCVATPTLAATNTIVSEASNNCVGTVGTYAANNNTITFTPATVLAAGDVYKFTVETSN
jgi:hypothetical protein